MAALLVEIKKEIDEKKEAGRLDKESIESFKERYDEIIKLGFSQNPPPTKESKKKAGPKRSKA